jgi:adenine-specific DNA-methyltransferase
MAMQIPSMDVQGLGQVFTSPAIVHLMLNLRRNNGRVLDPACGLGAFCQLLSDCVALEYDPQLAQQVPGALAMDFFAYPESELFDTIIGNPPYVAYKHIQADTKSRLHSQLFDERSNLYLFFIEKCIRHLKYGGELIFITPRLFLKLTASQQLNQWLYQQGTITDIIELGDARIFEAAVPNCIIWRFVKGNFSRKTNCGRHFIAHEGQLLFTQQAYPLRFNEVFFVKVGAVSGDDSIFMHPDGNREFVCSYTQRTGQTRRMIYNHPHPSLLAHKERLLARRTRRFAEHNWYEWGRYHYDDVQRPRIYVNCRTRGETPFFTHPCPDYDGSILAIFPKRLDLSAAQVEHLVQLLNEVNWAELGFVCSGRYLFSQKSLENTLLPAAFEPFRSQLQPQAVGLIPKRIVRTWKADTTGVRPVEGSE